MKMIIAVLMVFNVVAASIRILPLNLTASAPTITSSSNDVLIVNDLHKRAYFGWYRASQMPSTGWVLLSRTMLWAANYKPPIETRIALFTYDGTVNPAPPNDDAAAVYNWLIDGGKHVWNKTFGGSLSDGASCVVQTSDGGYALAGYTSSFGAGGYDFWLVKTDAAGNIEWNQTYGGIGNDYALCVIQTKDGGYAIAGYTKSYGAGLEDFWLVKTDSAGTMQWNKTYGGLSSEAAYSVVQTSDGGYAIAGYTMSFGAGSIDFWLVKTDEYGNMSWSKTYGGAGPEVANSVVQTSDGGYAIAGYTSSYGAGLEDFWLVKTDSAGTVQWNKTYGGTSDEVANSVVQTDDGGYAIAGYTFFYGPGAYDFLLVKTDSAGNMQWSKTYGGARADMGRSMVQTSDGGYALAGDTYSYGAGSNDFWLVKTDSAGNMQWNKTYGGEKADLAYSVVQTSDGGYALAGYTESYGAGSADFWLVKMDASGYLPENIKVHHQSDAETLPSTYYNDFDLVIYWNIYGYNSTNIVNSEVPFITVSIMQTDEMGIGTGNQTMHEYRNTFSIVNNNYYPTYNYPLGRFEFESEMWVDATEASGSGKVLVKADHKIASINVEMHLHQDVTVRQDGSANMSLTITVPNSPLADMYREAILTNPRSVPPGVEVSIPENKTVQSTLEVEEGVKDVSLVGDITGPTLFVPDGKVDIRDIALIAKYFGQTVPPAPPNCDITGPTLGVPDGKIDIRDIALAARNFGKTRPPPPKAEMPVREILHSGIVVDQAATLGFETNVTDSKIVPWGTNNETRISLKAYSPQLAKPIAPATWRINVGPIDDNATDISAESMMTKIQYIQQMLQSIPCNQTYLSTWNVSIKLPTGAELLNRDELIGLNWTVDFGGGTFMEANVTLDLPRVIVDEKTVVTEQAITASDEYLNVTFAHYRKFKIDYYLAGSLRQAAKAEEANNADGDWSKEWTWTISPGSYEKTWSYGSQTARLKATPRLDIRWYVGWHTKWWKLRWFETWMSITPSIKVDAYASVVGVWYSKTWSNTFASWSYRLSFWVGPVYVWANLKLTVEGSITVKVYGKISVTATTTASAWVKAGVRWEKGKGWSTIWDHGWGASKSISVTGAAGIIRITPSAKCRIAFLFYDVAGPFVDAIPYAPITIAYTSSTKTWSISLRFKIVAGVTMAGWLKKKLDLKSWETTLADWELASWSGSW